MKFIQGFLFSCFVYHCTAFSPSRQGIQHDVALRQHSWHDSDFYNSQSDVTKRPLHDKGQDNAYNPNDQEKFSASLYKRPGSTTFSPPRPVEPDAPTQPALQPPPAPVAHDMRAQSDVQPPPTTNANPAYQANAMQQDVLEKRLESLEKNVEEIRLTLHYIASILEKGQE